MGGMALGEHSTVGHPEPDQIDLRVGGDAVKLAVGVNVAVGIFGVLIVVAGLVPINGHSHPDISIAAAIPLIFFIVLYIFATGRSGTVTAESLVLKGSRLARPKSIPLTDVVAVGMIYTIQPRINGWRNYAWRSNGEAVELPLGLCMSPSPEEPDALQQIQDSRQGHICRQVFQQVLTCQGSGGLAAGDRETIRHGTHKRERAYWAANPLIGGIHALPRHK
jgi:hypothetical protein